MPREFDAAVLLREAGGYPAGTVGAICDLREGDLHCMFEVDDPVDGLFPVVTVMLSDLASVGDKVPSAEAIRRRFAEHDASRVDWAACPAVERSPGVLHGAWRVKGSRIPVEALLVNHAAGHPAEELAGMFHGLSAEDARAIIQHAAADRILEENAEVSRRLSRR